MRSVVLIPLLAALAAPASALARPAAVVKVTECVPSLVPAQRVASFEATVRAVAFTDRMQLRFTVQAKSGAQPFWHRVLTPGLDGWRTSMPGVRRYAYTRTLQNLSAPAAYRTIVRFRWLDADGDRLASARATSAVCRQRDLRPNLKPLGVQARPGADTSHVRYVVPVVNRGRSPAGPFDVVVAVDGTALPPAQTPELAPGERALVEVVGPPCSPGQPLTADVDPTGAVDERREDDNLLSVPCPGAPA